MTPPTVSVRPRAGVPPRAGAPRRAGPRAAPPRRWPVLTRPPSRRGGSAMGRGARCGGGRLGRLRASLAERRARRWQRPGPDASRGSRCRGRRRRGRAGWHVGARDRGRGRLAGRPQPGRLSRRRLDDRVGSGIRGDLAGGGGRRDRSGCVGCGEGRADAARDGGEERAARRAREAPVGHDLAATRADDRTFGHRSPRQPPRALGGPIACQTSGARSSPHSGQSRRRQMPTPSAAHPRSTPHAARRRPRRPARDRRSTTPRTR